MAEAGSPFRTLPWQLGMVRDFLRWTRLKRIALRARGRFRYGHEIAFGKNADVRPPHFVEFGHHVSVGKNFTCEADLKAGDYVLFSSNVSIIGKDHPFDDPALTIYSQRRVDTSVVEVGSDVLLGFGTIVIGSVKIGDGCIVGAGSVVTRNLPPYTICGGVPARVIRHRYPDRG